MVKGNVSGVVAVVRKQLACQYGSTFTDATALRVAADAGYLTLSRGRYGGKFVTAKGETLLNENGDLADIFGASDTDTAQILNAETF